MKKSNYFKVIGAIAVSTVVSLAYASFTEINSSGDIVSKDSEPYRVCRRLFYLS